MKEFTEFQLLQKVISATAQNWPNFSHISHKFFFIIMTAERERDSEEIFGDKYQ
jgi:hypothetical protein